jgi:hypothetical protein
MYALTIRRDRRHAAGVHRAAHARTGRQVTVLRDLVLVLDVNR